MKRFLINGFKFLIVVIAINIIVLVAVTPGYFAPYEESSLKFDEYILADSHGLAINDFAEKYGIYNFSAASDSYSDMARKLDYLIENTQVKKVYITLDDHILSPYRDKHNNNDRSIKYLSFTTIISDYSLIKEVLQRYFVLLNPKVRDYLNSFAKSQIKRILKPEEVGEDTEWSELPLEARKRIAQSRYELQFNYSGYSELMRQKFSEIVQKCRDNNIEIIGIRYPLSGVYLNLVNQDDKQVLQLAKENQIRVLDFKHEFKDRPDYFLNQDHLNRRGGAKLAELIGEIR
ncbi:hypothetical protein [Pleionea sediminis]|uniref:hypothetical protein n=1 Tax=Pleionea sediminis TaxID=2569479 RepID=UPI0011868DAD|nr:hypothetical protein [Pleionea sediminis]